MKTQFQPGDRVNVYGASQDGQLTCVEAKAGTVEAFSPNGLYVRVRFGMAHAKDFHVKQCRRLIKKPRREWWLVLPGVSAHIPCNERICKSMEEVRRYLDIATDEIIPQRACDFIVHVREIRGAK